MTLVFVYNTKKNQFLVCFYFFIFSYFQDINALEKNVFYEFKYVFSQILRYQHPCCFRGTLVYDVHVPVLDSRLK